MYTGGALQALVCLSACSQSY